MCLFGSGRLLSHSIEEMCSHPSTHSHTVLWEMRRSGSQWALLTTTLEYAENPVLVGHLIPFLGTALCPQYKIHGAVLGTHVP